MYSGELVTFPTGINVIQRGTYFKNTLSIFSTPFHIPLRRERKISFFGAAKRGAGGRRADDHDRRAAIGCRRAHSDQSDVATRAGAQRRTDRSDSAGAQPTYR